MVLRCAAEKFLGSWRLGFDSQGAQCLTQVKTSWDKCLSGRVGQLLTAPEGWWLFLSAPGRADAQLRCTGNEGEAVSTI